MSKNTLLVGTAKGLIEYQFSKDAFGQKRIHFLGFSVSMVFVDARNSRWWVGLDHKHWGQKLHYSDDMGTSWLEAEVPTFSDAQMPDGNSAKLRQIWSMQQGGPQYPDRLWLGTSPGGLFLSSDNGVSWDLVKSLWEHPSRKKEGQWFGTRGDFPFIHSIVLDHENPDHAYIAVSAAGVFETTDSGETWVPKNNGLKASYLPNPTVEVGHDPHMLLMSPADNQVLWQQNHCGVFVSRNFGEKWEEVSGQHGIPNYGFALQIDERDPAKAWVIPVESDASRVAPGLKLEVYATSDFGKTWRSESDGLPEEAAFDIVLRHAFAKSGEIMAFGTTNGNLYFRVDKNPWKTLFTNLTKVSCVRLI